MRKLLDIARRSGANEAEYHQVFVYETDDDQATVASALKELNAQTDLRDHTGASADPIRWECSCLQKKCGACAMVINGRPQVACDARLVQFKGERITLEPLRKFPVVADLLVDRRALFDRLDQMEAWLTQEAPLVRRTAHNQTAYEASRCLQCGCCLEVCPNFSTQGAFGGMAAAMPLSRLLAVTRKQARGVHADAYRSGIYAGCGKSLACRNVCPAGIDVGRLMSRSNAAAVWRLL